MCTFIRRVPYFQLKVILIRSNYFQKLVFVFSLLMIQAPQVKSRSLIASLQPITRVQVGKLFLQRISLFCAVSIDPKKIDDH